MKRFSILLATAAAMAMTSGVAHAGSNEGKIQVKGFLTAVLPDGKITDVRNNGLGLPAGSQTTADDNYTPTVAIEYFLSPSFSIETIAGMTQHDVVGAGAIAGATLIRNANIIPATVTGKLHINTGSGFKPYIGAGPAYFFTFSEGPDATARALGITSADLSDELGLALQAGFDLPLNDKGLGLSVDAKRYFIDTTATFRAGNAIRFQSEHKLDPWVVSAGLAYRF